MEEGGWSQRFKGVVQSCLKPLLPNRRKIQDRWRANKLEKGMLIPFWGYFQDENMEREFLKFRQDGRMMFLLVFALVVIVIEVCDVFLNLFGYSCTDQRTIRQALSLFACSVLPCVAVLAREIRPWVEWTVSGMTLMWVLAHSILSSSVYLAITTGSITDPDSYGTVHINADGKHVHNFLDLCLIPLTASFVLCIVAILPMRRPALMVTLVGGFSLSVAGTIVLIAFETDDVTSLLAVNLALAVVAYGILGLMMGKEEYGIRLMFCKIGRQSTRINNLLDEVKQLLKVKSSASSAEELTARLSGAGAKLRTLETTIQKTCRSLSPKVADALRQTVRNLINELNAALVLASNTEHLLDINLMQVIKNHNQVSQERKPKSARLQLRPTSSRVGFNIKAGDLGEDSADRDDEESNELLPFAAEDESEDEESDSGMFGFLTAHFSRQRQRRSSVVNQSFSHHALSSENGSEDHRTESLSDDANRGVVTEVDDLLMEVVQFLPLSLNEDSWSEAPMRSLSLSRDDPERDWNLDIRPLNQYRKVLSPRSEIKSPNNGVMSPTSTAHIDHGGDGSVYVGKALPLVGLQLLRNFLTDPLKLSNVTRVLNFLLLVEKGYTDAPYHNSLHGADVAIMAVWLTEHVGIRKLLSPLRSLSVVIAALCHDIGHEGVNNMFQVNSKSELALLYNDQAILENFHAAQTFRILRIPGCQILSKLREEDWRTLRSAIIELILETDMAKHFEFLSMLKVRVGVGDFQNSISMEAWNRHRQESGVMEVASQEKKTDLMEQDVWMVARACIKAADLGHSAKPWPVHYRYSLAVTEEFFRQGDLEKQLRLPVSPLCNRDASNAAALCKSQHGFLNFVCREIFVELAAVERLSKAVPTRLARMSTIGLEVDKLHRGTTELGRRKSRLHSMGVGVEAARASVKSHGTSVRVSAASQAAEAVQRQQTVAIDSTIETVCLSNLEENVRRWSEKATAADIPESLFTGPGDTPTANSLICMRPSGTALRASHSRLFSPHTSESAGPARARLSGSKRGSGGEKTMSGHSSEEMNDVASDGKVPRGPFGGGGKKEGDKPRVPLRQAGQASGGGEEEASPIGGESPFMEPGRRPKVPPIAHLPQLMARLNDFKRGQGGGKEEGKQKGKDENEDHWSEEEQEPVPQETEITQTRGLS